MLAIAYQLKSMSVRSWRTSLRLPRNPCIAARVLLNRANLSFFLFMYVCQDRCIAYHGSLWFSASFSAGFLLTLVHIASRDDHYLVCWLDIWQDSKFTTRLRYGYPKTVFKRELDWIRIRISEML